MASPDGLLSDVRRRLLEGPANVLRCPAPTGKALCLVDAEIGGAGVFWEQDASSAGPALSIVGMGTAALLRASGDGRFRTMAAEQAAIFESLRLEAPRAGTDTTGAEWLRFFGGSAFSTGRDGSGCWEDFGDSSFLLPRVVYVDGPNGAEFLIVDAPSAPGGSERTLEVLAAALEATKQAPPLRASAQTLIETTRQSAGPDEFEELVSSAQERIRAGEVDKIALARRVTLTLSAAPRVGALLERLRITAPLATRFAFRIGERTFVGATPETLIRRRGLSLETEALAGTARARSGAAEELRASVKDQDEHRFVVDAIQQALAPLCRRLDIAPEATIKELPRLLHLCTPIRGELERPLHVLELVERLHPTPAVCGSPREEAFRFIVEHEAAPRGWYAAPFGWVDRSGDGDFVVGLRSALLHGRNVHLYAGAGIVRASVPKLEYDETELKLESIRSALGLTVRPSIPAPLA